MPFNQEKFRGDLAGELSETPKEERKEKLEKAKESKEYWQAREHAIQGKEDNAEMIDEGLGLLIKHKTLYHGSSKGGIEKIKPSDDVTTVGDGVYLTTAPEAIGYSLGKARAGNEPTIYEAKIENVRIMDLRLNENVYKVLPGFVDAMRKKVSASSAQAHIKSSIEQDIRKAEELIATKELHAGNISEITRPYGEWFTEYIQSHGYDGLATYEGGEHGHYENHESWLVFDPEKVKITKKHGVTKKDDAEKGK